MEEYSTFVVCLKKIEHDRRFLEHFQCQQSGFIKVSVKIAVNVVRGGV